MPAYKTIPISFSIACHFSPFKPYIFSRRRSSSRRRGRFYRIFGENGPAEHNNNSPYIKMMIMPDAASAVAGRTKGFYFFTRTWLTLYNMVIACAALHLKSFPFCHGEHSEFRGFLEAQVSSRKYSGPRAIVKLLFLLLCPFPFSFKMNRRRGEEHVKKLWEMRASSDRRRGRKSKTFWWC